MHPGDIVNQYMLIVFIIISIFLEKIKMRDFYVLFVRKAHNTEHLSRGCPHLVLISQLSRLKQC